MKMQKKDMEKKRRTPFQNRSAKQISKIYEKVNILFNMTPKKITIERKIHSS